jgi:ankyrin repeat protein
MRVLNVERKTIPNNFRICIFSANVHLEDQFKWTALHHAAHSGQLGVVRTLIDAGAKINHESLTLATPLSRAIESSALDVVNYLIEKRANVRHENLTRMSKF